MCICATTKIRQLILDFDIVSEIIIFIVGEVRKAEELIEEIERAGISRDTLITLGCFSECWDDNNKPETIKLIKYFLQKGNQIQLATKKEITVDKEVIK